MFIKKNSSVLRIIKFTNVSFFFLFNNKFKWKSANLPADPLHYMYHSWKSQKSRMEYYCKFWKWIERFDFKITTPSNYSVAANGKLMSETFPTGSTKLTFWRTMYPTAAYLIALSIFLVHLLKFVATLKNLFETGTDCGFLCNYFWLLVELWWRSLRILNMLWRNHFGYFNL